MTERKLPDVGAAIRADISADAELRRTTPYSPNVFEKTMNAALQNISFDSLPVATMTSFAEAMIETVRRHMQLETNLDPNQSDLDRHIVGATMLCIASRMFDGGVSEVTSREETLPSGLRRVTFTVSCQQHAADLSEPPLKYRVGRQQAPSL